MELFPPGSLGDQPDEQSFRERWYGSHLSAMQESPLYPPDPNLPEQYRLLFLPTFQQSTVVHLTNAGGAWRAICKRSDGDSGFSPGRLTSTRGRDLLGRKARKFAQLLDGMGFWDMSSFEESGGLDGSRAVLEGIRAGTYHVVDRWSPEGTPYAKLVEFLL